MLIETGMRKGEAAALKWTDIDFKKKDDLYQCDLGLHGEE